jgi:hypothetical protein
MNKYLVTATLQVEYEVPVIAEDEEQALATLDDWIADDFKDYQTDAVWSLGVIEND